MHNKNLLTFSIYSLVITLIITEYGINCERKVRIPSDLLIGTATSSYQVEGAWDADGKGPSIWDHFTHNTPNKIVDGSNGDIACDSYHKIKEDVQMIKKAGFQFYRFSISWPRILPTGFPNIVNQPGIDYYNKLINELIAHNILPMVTMYHWDLPQTLQELGGFANSEFSNWFEDYSRILFTNFGDRVKHWITLNEPKQICFFGYGKGVFAPGIEQSGIGDYLCGHNLIKAHARAYHLYDSVFRPKQKGIISIVIECAWSEPATNKTEDIEAADRWRQFDFGMYAHPIFHKDGGYPQVVKEAVAIRSKQEGFTRSRFPEFTAEEVDYIKGTWDFFGLNHYSTVYAKHKTSDPIGTPHLEKDKQVDIYQDDDWLTGTFSFFRLVPWGFRKVLNYIKDNYQNPDIYVTENGFPDIDTLNDKDRITYFRGNLEAVVNASVLDQVSIKSFATWTLVDNFEWAEGYTIKFGLHRVNFSDPQRPRTERDSVKFLREIINSREFLIN